MIQYNEAARTLTLFTPHTCYQMKVDEQNRLLHTWYGRRPADPADCPDLSEHRAPHHDPGCWPDLLPLEFAAPGVGDNRIPAVVPAYADGTEAADLRYAGHTIHTGKYLPDGLPAFRSAACAQSLCVRLRDEAGLEVALWYSVYADCDVITRAAVYQNTGAEPLVLRQAASICLDMPGRPLDWLTLDGMWAGERTVCRAPLRPGEQTVGSTRGIPGHGHSPSVVLCTPEATETGGECWGMTLVYSGNFEITAERCEAGVRLIGGIHPYHFAWTLMPGQTFAAPEAALVYSAEGLGTMSRRFHDAIRGHLLPPAWGPQRRRPVLINSWEAFYFDFDEERLLNLARAGRKAGMDLLVVDDGWFLGRRAETSSLGDWRADPEKLPNGLPGLCRRLADLGMELGIWVEPEAVSPNSELFRAHPDWALLIPERAPFEVRNQYVLDFSRPEVVDGIWAQLDALLSSCDIRYLKWDMNRGLATVYSAALPAGRQGEVYHRYVLGVYELQRRLTERYPDLLVENCAGGGARFDCGMLCYAPQIWTSDNTDAQARLSIQYGTSLIYPAEAMGAHFSSVPNHCTGRLSSIDARMAAALSGTFGFELDVTAYSAEQLAQLAPHIDWYRAHGALIRGGDLYRIMPPSAGEPGAAWAFVAKDQREAAVFCVGTALAGRGERCPRLVLQGLDEGAVYEDEAGTRYSGFLLATLGLPLPGTFGQMPAARWYLKRIG